MKQIAIYSLLSLVLLLNCSRIPVPPEEPTPEAKLKALEAHLAEIAASDLPDFATELYQSVGEKVSELRQIFDEQGRMPDPLLQSAREEMSRFDRVANGAQKFLAEAYRMRNSARQLDFIRAYSPAQFYRAEQNYQEALQLANREQFDRLPGPAKAVTGQYQSLIQNAQRELKSRIGGDLEHYRATVTADLNALNAVSTNSGELAAADGVFYRINLGQHAWNNPSLNGDIVVQPPYFPPPPTPPGPRPASGIGVGERTATTIRLIWADVSDNETGSRVLRSTDLLNWQIVAEVGPVPKFDTFTYTDTNLQPDTRYCYQIETYNDEGARRSQLLCTYTHDGNAIPVWRLQLRVKVANLANAGSDNPLRVMVANNGQYLPTETILDYGQDDFERNSDFTYDLNFDDIHELSDITDLRIINYGNDQDDLYISELSLLVNQHEAFRRNFGVTNSSVLKLGYYGSFSVEHAELRSDPTWQAFVASSRNDRFFNVPPVSISDNGQFQVVISREQIASRIESLMGHLLHADSELRGRFKWGFLSGPAVEVTRAGNNSVHVDLDLEVEIDWWPNAALDIDFDIKVEKSCDNAAHKMTLKLTSQNFTSNADYQLWKDIASLGFTKLTADLIDWYAENCSTPFQVSREFEVDIPEGINCDDLQVSVDAAGNVVICCFALTVP